MEGKPEAFHSIWPSWGTGSPEPRLSPQLAWAPAAPGAQHELAGGGSHPLLCLGSFALQCTPAPSLVPTLRVQGKA